ncbi:hypothetical protein GJ496_003602 [Pomphorhynchus laevis]|nr:hypothetical protein GJ496_003602 [Pomphorhynchus laevis]
MVSRNNQSFDIALDYFTHTLSTIHKHSGIKFDVSLVVSSPSSYYFMNSNSTPKRCCHCRSKRSGYVTNYQYPMRQQQDTANPEEQMESQKWSLCETLEKIIIYQLDVISLVIESWHTAELFSVMRQRWEFLKQSKIIENVINCCDLNISLCPDLLMHKKRLTRLCSESTSAFRQLGMDKLLALKNEPLCSSQNKQYLTFIQCFKKKLNFFGKAALNSTIKEESIELFFDSVYRFLQEIQYSLTMIHECISQHEPHGVNTYALIMLIRSILSYDWYIIKLFSEHFHKVTKLVESEEDIE